MPLSLIFLLILLQLGGARQLFQAFAKKYSQRSLSVASKLPTIPDMKSQKQQLEDYEQKQASAVFTDFMGDPALNVNIMLTQQQRRSKVLFMGRQLSRLVMSVTLQIYLLNIEAKLTCVGLFIYNCDTNQLVYSAKVINAILIDIPLESGLYSIILAHESELMEVKIQRDQEIVVHILMDIVDERTLIEQKETATSLARKGVLLMENLAALASSYDQVFSESLSAWGEVEAHREDHFTNLKDIEIRSYLEIMIVSLINFLQVVLLWKAMTGRGVV